MLTKLKSVTCHSRQGGTENALVGVMSRARQARSKSSRPTGKRYAWWATALTMLPRFTSEITRRGDGASSISVVSDALRLKKFI